MFDDVNNTNDPAKEDNTAPTDNNNQSQQEGAPKEPENKPEPAPATNISTPPVSSPLNAPSKAPESNEKIEDMFAESEPDSPSINSAQPYSGQTEQEESKPAVFQPKETQEATGQEEEEPKGSSWQKIVIPLVLIIGIGLLGVGGVYGYRAIIKYLAGEEVVEQVENEINPDSQADMASQPVQDTKNTPDDAMVSPDPIASPSVAIPNTKDSDNDGLTDAEEAALGTNALSVDTDDDGLFDREEVKVYSSNPLVTDTDGDGFMDGDEVRAGYNPVGEGKLYEIRQ